MSCLSDPYKTEPLKFQAVQEMIPSDLAKIPCIFESSQQSPLIATISVKLLVGVTMYLSMWIICFFIFHLWLQFAVFIFHCYYLKIKCILFKYIIRITAMQTKLVVSGQILFLFYIC